MKCAYFFVALLQVIIISSFMYMRIPGWNDYGWTDFSN